MAFWRAKRVKGRDYVFIYTYREGRQTQVKPRSLYAHLDAFLAQDHQHHRIDAWVKTWAAQYENAKITPDHLLFSDDQISKYLRDFRAHLKVRERLEPGTYNKYYSLLLRFVVPFYLSQDPPLKDPQAWPGSSIRLLEYLESKGCNPPNIRETNNALRRFWEWLRQEHLVVHNVPLYLRSPAPRSNKTPLPHTVTPEQVLTFAIETPLRQVKLMALLGYFFSLRPQETFGLIGADFRAGRDTRSLACCTALDSLGLFRGFAVEIARQRTALGRLNPPKSHSMGWVGCFDEKAAGLLVALLNETDDPARPLFQIKNRDLYKQWKQATASTVLNAITLKDLRRASIYHLGHHTPFQNASILLMKHARHKEFETTALYLRRPDEPTPKTGGKLDLGA